MDYRLDEIDKRILYRLVQEARNTTTREIAEEVDVSPGTISNRTERMEANGIIEGYHADVDYEAAEGLLTHIYLCHAPAPEREQLTEEVLRIPGVVNVRRAMLGRENLHVVAVGPDTNTISSIRRTLTDLGLEVEREGLIEEESYRPYRPYGPNGEKDHTGKDFLTVAGDARLTELSLPETAPVVGMTVREAAEADVLSEDVLVVAIERGDAMVTPKGDVEFRRGDIVTLLFRNSISQSVLDEFGGEIIHR